MTRRPANVAPVTHELSMAAFQVGRAVLLSRLLVQQTRKTSGVASNAAFILRRITAACEHLARAVDLVDAERVRAGTRLAEVSAAAEEAYRDTVQP